MQPLSDLDELVNSAKGIIKKYADMGDKNFSMLNDVVNGTKTMAGVKFVNDAQELTTGEKDFMQTVLDKLVACGRCNDDNTFSAFQESKIISKGSKGGKKRSNKHSKKRSNKNRGRRTTSHRRRSRARV